MNIGDIDSWTFVVKDRGGEYARVVLSLVAFHNFKVFVDEVGSLFDSRVWPWRTEDLIDTSWKEMLVWIKNM